MAFYNDGVIILSLTTVILGFFIMTLKLILNLKCHEINCCGLCIIKRTVELEANNEI